MDKIHSSKYIPFVIEDILSHPDIQQRVEKCFDEFVSFASLERVNYYPDIYDELECFFKRRRLYETNVKEWYRIRELVFKRDNYTCQYCGKVGGKLEADHVMPFSKGGSNELSNLVTACRKCNRQKRDKSKDEYIEWLRTKHISIEKF